MKRVGFNRMLMVSVNIYLIFSWNRNTFIGFLLMLLMGLALMKHIHGIRGNAFHEIRAYFSRYEDKKFNKYLHNRKTDLGLCMQISFFNY